MICTACNRPIKRKGRTIHVTCAQAQALHAEQEIALNDARRFAPLTIAPERCAKCGEALTPGVTKGRIQCRCDQPSMPRHLRNNDKDDRPPMQVRYGN